VEDGTILYPILALAFVVLVGVVLWVFVRRIEGVLASGRRVIARQKQCRLVRKGFWGSAIGSICANVFEESRNPDSPGRGFPDSFWSQCDYRSRNALRGGVGHVNSR
jgi:hypothetical protein